MRTWLALPALFAASCYSPRPYHSQSVGPGPAATIVATAGAAGADPFHVVMIDIYGYEHGCPDLAYRTTSSGYKGSVYLGPGSREFTVPAGRRIVLKGGWSGPSTTCASVMSFRPEDGAIYLYEYSEPSQNHCASAAAQIVKPSSPDQDASVKKIDALTAVHPRLGFMGYSAEELCALPP